MDPNISVPPPQPTTPDIQTSQPVFQPTQSAAPEIQPIVSPIPEQPSQPKPKLSKWIIAVAVILFLVIVGSVSAFVLNKNSASKPQPNAETIVASPTPTPDPIANWKTYTGNGFSIKYPASWKIEVLSQDVKNLDSIFLKEDSTHVVTLSFSTDKFSSIYPEYINNSKNPKIKINGYDAYPDTGFAGLGAFYLVNSNEQFANISPGTILDKELFNQILSTFKFTNQIIQTIPTSSPTLTIEPIANWKTYTSSDNGFSIKAPSTWTVDNSFPSMGNVECLYLDDNNLIILSACYRHSKLADSIFSGVPTRSGVIKTEINGLVAYNDKSLSLNDYYIVNSDGTFILITPGAYLDSTLFEKVVFTFKFTQ